MKLLILVAGLLVCALAVGAQEPAAPDYYDYYDDAAADAAALEAVSDQGASVPGKETALAEEAPVSEAPVTEIPVTTTTESRRKLVSLKSTKINRNRGEARHSNPTPAPLEEFSSTTSDSGATVGRRFGGSSLVRSGVQRTSNSRLTGSVSTQQDAETTTDTSSSSGPTRSRFRPSARNEPASTSADESQTTTTTNRFQPRRSSFRPSISSSSSDTATEETSDKPVTINRFKPASRSSFRPSATRSSVESTTLATTEETTSHRFSTRRGGRGNSRGGANFPPTRASHTTPVLVDEAAPEEEVLEGEESANVTSSDPSRFGRRSRG